MKNDPTIDIKKIAEGLPTPKKKIGFYAGI